MMMSIVNVCQMALLYACGVMLGGIALFSLMVFANRPIRQLASRLRKAGPLNTALSLLAIAVLVAYGGTKYGPLVPMPEDAFFRVTPYVQHPATNAMTILWVSDRNAWGMLEVWPASDRSRYRFHSVWPREATELDYFGYSHPRQYLPAGTQWQYRYRLTDLEPDTEYGYRVYYGNGESYTNSFRTAPMEFRPVHFVAYSDSETQPSSTGDRVVWENFAVDHDTTPNSSRRYYIDQTEGYASNICAMVAGKPDFIVIAGDLAEKGSDQTHWDEFWRHNAGELNDPAGSTPILAAPGNHEYHGYYAADDYGERGMRKFLSYFEFEPNGTSLEEDRQERFHRVDYGPVAMIFIDPNNGRDYYSDSTSDMVNRENGTPNMQDTTQPLFQDRCRAPDFNPGSVQYQWLEEQLADAQTNKLFTFLVCHQCPFSVGYHGRLNGEYGTESSKEYLSGAATRCLTNLVFKYGVDAWLCGHDELYEHSRLTGTETLPDGTTRSHTVNIYDVGMGGDGLRGCNRTGRPNPYEVYRAHVDAPEVYDETGTLISGGKHYGHMDVKVDINVDGIWTATLTPTYVFVSSNTVTGKITFDRRTYPDVVVVTNALSAAGKMPPEIRNVKASQRYPWNGKVDVTYEAVGDMVEGLLLQVTATDLATGSNHVASASALSGDTNTMMGVHHVVWDLEAQGLALKSDNVVFSVAHVVTNPLYCVIDLSGGPNAESYPVSYLPDAPFGGWSDRYKTDKLVLRRIEPGPIPTHDAAITKPYYIGVFGVTQRQYELVMDDRPSYFSNELYYATRPVEQVSYDMIRGSSLGSGWPSSSAVDMSSFLGRLRAKTGVDGFDLPTEAQWEYACRAGTATDYNSGKNYTSTQYDDAMAEVGRYGGNSGQDYSENCTPESGTAKVGSYLPNAWGVYDMHGNLWEWCLDWRGDSLSGDDPVGASTGIGRMLRGGFWRSAASACSSHGLTFAKPSQKESCIGFRIARTLPESEGEYNPETVADAKGAYMVCIGESASVTVDVVSGTRTVTATERICCSAAWADDAPTNATAVVEVDGATLSSVHGSGFVDWTPARPGPHVLAHKVIADGILFGETLTASFLVDGTLTIDGVTNHWFETAETQNGTVSVAGRAALSAPRTGGWVADGETLALTAVPEEHYHFVEWTGDWRRVEDNVPRPSGEQGTQDQDATENPLVLTMDRPRAIGAEFAIDTFTVTFEAGTHGAISGAAVQTIDYGGLAAVPTVTPGVGYAFTGWTGDVTTPVTSNVTFTARYATIPYAITYTGLKGATNPNPATYTVEDEIAFVAPGDVYGWVFTGWTPAVIVRGSTGAAAVAASWERQKFEVTVNGETRQYYYEDTVALTTDAVVYVGATQYVCTGWAATNAEPGTGTGTHAEFTVLGNVSFDWLWETNVVTLAQAINAEVLDTTAEELEWTTGGAVEWHAEWTDEASDGPHDARCGAIPNGTNAWIATTVEGPGTLAFSWRSALASRNLKYQVMVDGDVKGMIVGTNDWRTVSMEVLGARRHEIRWRLLSGRSGTVPGDWVALDGVAWTPAVPPTLAEALNTNLVWTTEGDVLWRGVSRESLVDERDAWTVADGLGDNETATVQTRVFGSGILLFDWAISCEEDYDWMVLVVDDEIRAYITGERGWMTSAIAIRGEGWHTVAWMYVKDEMDDAELVGENVARLDNVVWRSEGMPLEEMATDTPVPVPYSELETTFAPYLEQAEGDYEAAARLTGRNGYTIWQSYLAGLAPEDENSRFRARIEIEGDQPVVTWTPDTPELRATRTYTIYGKKTLLDREWTPVTDANRCEYNFFKVKVRMK